MKSTASQKTKQNDQETVLYDGNCEFCTLGKEFVEKRDESEKYRFVDTHSDEGKAVQQQLDLNTENSAYIVRKENVIDRSDVALVILGNLGGIYTVLAYVGKLFPKSFRDYIYSIIARNRLRISSYISKSKRP